MLIIDESYNANPASMAATLRSLGSETKAKRRIAVLGPMRELGSHSDALHAGLAPEVIAAEGRPADSRGRGNPRRSKSPWRAASRSTAPQDVDDAARILKDLLQPWDAVLVKASNSVGLARLVDQVAGELGTMLYLIADALGFPGILNLIRYISFRAGAASATALLIGLVLGPWFISWLRVRQGKGQPIRADGPQSHLAKRGTPTMGGLLILVSMTVSVLLWMDLTNPYVWACLAGHPRLRADRLPRRLRQGHQGASRRPVGQGCGWSPNSSSPGSRPG